MASIFSATGISLSLFVSLVSLCVTHGISLSSRNPSLSKPLNHAPQTIVACCVLHNICQIEGEPEPKLFKDPKETVVLPLPIVRPLESEKSFYCFGESLRQAMADDLQERHQRLLQRRLFSNLEIELVAEFTLTIVWFSCLTWVHHGCMGSAKKLPWHH